MARGVRHALRWLARIGLGVLAAVLVVLAAALIVIHTDWGRDKVRAQVEASLRDVLPGGAKIGKLEGSVLGTLIVRDVELDSLAHRPLVRVGALRVSAAIWPLISKTVRVESIVVEDVALDPSAGPLVPPRPDDDTPPPAWRVELPHIELHRAAVDLGDPSLAVRALELAAGVTIVGRDITAHAWLDTGWGDKHVTGVVTAQITNGAIRVPAAVLALDAAGGRARIAAHDVTVDVVKPRGTVVVSAPAKVIDVWWPAASQVAALGAPLGDAVVRVELGDDAADATKIGLVGAVGTTKLAATLHAALATLTARGVIALRDVALAPITRGSLHGTGALLVGVDASLAHVTATLAILPRLIADPDPAALDRAAKALAAAAPGAPGAPLGPLGPIARDLAGPGAPAAPRVLATAELIRHGTAWSLGATRVAGTIAGVSAAGTPVRGTLAFQVAAQPARAPTQFLDADVAGSFELRGGGFTDLAVARVASQLRGHVTGGDVDAHVALAADGIARAGKPLGRVRLAAAYRTGQPIAIDVAARPAAAPIAAEASLRVTLGDLIRIDLPRLALELPGGKRWNGGGGVVTIGDRIALRNLGLRHGPAVLEVGGQLDPARGDFAAKVTASHIELATLSPKLRGEAGSVISVERRHQRWRADAALDITGLAAGKATPPTDAAVHLALGDDQLAITARASSPDTGALELAIAASAPRDPTDVAAWRRLDARAIHTAKITARQLQIGGLVERAAEADLEDDEAKAKDKEQDKEQGKEQGKDSPADAVTDGAPGDPIRGTIDGELDLAPANPGGTLAIRGVGLPFGVLDGDVELAPHDGALAVKLDARMPNVAVAHVAAELGVPVHPFDPATWRGGGRGLLRQADASIDKVRVNAAMLERLGIAQKLAARGIVIPYRASIAARAHLGAGANAAQVDLDLTAVRGGVLVQSVSQHLELSADSTGTTLHGELRGGGVKRGEEGNVPLGTLDATLATTMAQWLTAPRSALGAALSARWVLPETAAIPVLAIFGRKELIGGTLAIDAEVHGTPLAPIVDHADLTARKLAVAPPLGGRAPPTFEELAVSARLVDGAASVTVRGRESGGGALDAKLDTSLAADSVVAAATGVLSARQVDLAPIAALLPGRFSAAAGSLDGRLALAGGKVSGGLTVTGGALPIAPVIGTLHDATAKLSITDRILHVDLTGGLGGGAIQLTADAPPDLATANAHASLTKVALLGARRTEISAEVGAKLKLAGGQVDGDLVLTRVRIHVAQRAGVPLLEVSAPDDLLLPGGAQRTQLAAAPPIAPARPSAANAPAAPANKPIDAPPKPSVINLHVALGATALSAPDAVQIIPGVDVATVHATAHSERGLDVAIGDTVAVVGRIEIDSGDVDFLGRRYLITPSTSAVAFDGSVDPLLLIQMSYAFPAMTLTADVRGRVSAPDPHLSADVVGYSDDQLFAFFLGGSPGNDPGTDTSTNDAVTAALAKVASGAIGRQFNKILPVKIDSVACAPGTTAASKSCTVGKQLSRRLYLYYSTRPTPLPNEATNEVQLQYRLNNTTLIDVTGGNGGDGQHASADVLSRHPW